MPRIVDHGQRRAEICDVLLDVVAEAGLAAVTLRGVAERGGWSTGVLNHYFRNRDDLLLGGLRRAAEHLAVYNRKILDTLDSISAIEHLLEGSFPIDGRRLALCRIFVFFYVEGMHHEEQRLEVCRYLAAWRGAVAMAIRRAQDLGDLPGDLDDRQAAMDLIGLVDGLSMHALLDEKVMRRIRDQSPVRLWIQNLSRREPLTPLRPASIAVRLANPKL